MLCACALLRNWFSKKANFIMFSFYYFKGIEYELALILLIENLALKRSHKLRILCKQGMEEQLDALLWTKKQLSFIPHGVEGDDMFATSVLISSNEISENANSLASAGFQHDILLSLLPQSLEKRHNKVVYLINNAELEGFKSQFSLYKQHGDECKLHILENKKWHTCGEMVL